jgi:uncharacterized C2H2 Zn-finger protein
MQKTWIDKLNMLISPEEADVIKLGGVDSEEALKSHIDASISREAEDRWRCTVPKCTKLFLEQKFVHSHIQKRHKEWLERANVEVFSPKTHIHIHQTYSLTIRPLFIGNCADLSRVVGNVKPVRSRSMPPFATGSRTTTLLLHNKTRKRIFRLKIRSPTPHSRPTIHRISPIPKLPESNV